MPKQQHLRVGLLAAPPRLFTLAWPLFVELLLGMAIGILGTVLAARLSDASGAAFALAHHVFGTLFIVFRIVGAGIGVVVTQALGAGRRDRADALACAVLGASTWMGSAVALVAVLGAQPLLRLLNAPAEVLPLAAPFLVALAPALLLDAWNASMTAVLRAHLRARETLAVMVAMQLTHLALLGPLMFGLGGLPTAGWGGGWSIPALGLPGYALALLASRLLALGLHLWLWRQRLQLVPRWADAWQIKPQALREVAQIGVPAAAENIVYRLSFMVSVAVVAAMGAQALATHAYAQQVIMLVLLEPGRTFNLVVINALRAAGDARYPVLAGAASMVVVLAGGSWLLGSDAGLGLGLPGVWMAYTADEWVRGLLMWRRWQRLAWVPHARASRRRLVRA